MRININQEAKDSFNTNIGKLYIFNINVKDHDKLTKAVGGFIKQCNPNSYARNLIVFVCFPKESLTEGKYKPDSPTISFEDAMGLSDFEVEEFSKKYVENNDYLTKKLEFKKRKDEKGKNVHYGEYNDIEHSKKDDESWLNYLHRLAIINEEKQIKTVEKMIGSFAGLNSFSSKLNENIKNTISWGDSLRKTMEGIGTIHPAKIQATTHVPPQLDFAEIERKKEQRRREPFNDLANRLDQLIDSSVQYSEFMIEANKLQMEIASEIKTGGDVTVKYSKRNIIIGFVVIFLTIFSLIYSIWTNKNSSDFNVNQLRDVEKFSNSIVSEISSMNRNIEQKNDNTQTLIRELSKILDELGQVNRNKELIIRRNEKVIGELVNELNKEKRKIKILNDKIKDIESKLKIKTTNK